MVVMMNWTVKYRYNSEFLDWFLTEQEFIDAMFVQMIMYNFGIWLMQDELYENAS